MALFWRFIVVEILFVDVLLRGLIILLVVWGYKSRIPHGPLNDNNLVQKFLNKLVLLKHGEFDLRYHYDFKFKLN